MKYIVEDNINLIEEVISTLYFIVNEEQIVKKLRGSFKKFDQDVDKYINKDLKNFFKFIGKFKIKNKIPIDRLKIFFKDISEVYEKTNCIAGIFINNITEDELIKVRNRIQNLDSMELKELAMKDILCQDDYFSDDFSIEDELYNLDVEKEFMPYLIERCTLDSESKWWLTVISQNPKEYFSELIDIIIDSIDVFKEAFKVMEKEVEKSIDELKALIEENPKFISDSTGMKIFDKWGNDIYIYLSIIRFNSVSFVSTRNYVFNNERREYMYFGWKFYELLCTSIGNDNEEKVLIDRLKCLSDKSKFNIIKMLKKKSMFGQEIAAALSLTTATVSYHMNALIVAKLVYMEKIDNKIFYSVDKDTMDEFLRTLNKELN